MSRRPCSFARQRPRCLAFAGLLLIAAALVASGGPPLPFVTSASAESELLVVRLFERNGSGVSAEAKFTAKDLETEIRVVVAAEDGAYLPYLHRGTCFSFSESLSVPLSIATPGEPSETTVDLDLETLAAGDIVVDLHLAEGSLESLMDPATSVACGTIRLTEANDDGAVVQAPIAGIGPLDVRDGWRRTATLLLCGAALAATLAGWRAGRTPLLDEPVVIDVVAMHRLRGLFP